MPFYKNVSGQKFVVYAHDTAADDPKTGDAANITAYISVDAAAATATNDTNPTELDATRLPGVYAFDAAQGESNGDVVILDAVSVTGNIQIEPLVIYTYPLTSIAAGNLQSQYDTTGITGDTFPATQSQLAGIANVGSAVNTPADSYTLTTGIQSSGTYADTAALDGTNHEHTDDAGSMDLYYEFVIGSGIPVSVVVTGYLNGNNDDLEVYGYDWVATAWVQIGELNGKNASSNEVNSYDLFVNMVGSGANEGIVRVRFTDGAFTLTSATLAIDQIFVSFSRGAEGYDNGAIWIDTTASNTNTVVGVDGTARNPVSTIAAANTLSASTNLNRFEIAPGSSITFAASQDNQVFNGMNWALALGGQSVSGSHITGATVSGICTGASTPEFTNCHFGATTLPPSRLDHSNLQNTITAGSAGDFFFDRCHSGIAGTGTPVFDFGGALAASNVNFRGYSGGIEIQNMGAGAGTYNMSLEGDGALVINANCSATSNVALRGNFKLTDNAGGAVTITTDDDTTDINAILVDTGTTIPAQITGLNDPTTAEIATAVMASTIDGTLTLTTATKVMLALMTAKGHTKTGDVYTFQDQAGATLVTVTIAGNNVTAVIA